MVPKCGGKGPQFYAQKAVFYVNHQLVTCIHFSNANSKSQRIFKIVCSTMLDSFEILTTSGIVLWSRSYNQVNPSLVNGLIQDVFIEEKILPGAISAGDGPASRNPPYKRDQYTLKWKTAKDLGLIFVVCFVLKYCFL